MWSVTHSILLCTRQPGQQVSRTDYHLLQVLIFGWCITDLLVEVCGVEVGGLVGVVMVRVWVRGIIGTTLF